MYIFLGEGSETFSRFLNVLVYAYFTHFNMLILFIYAVKDYITYHIIYIVYLFSFLIKFAKFIFF